jgi:hypothetical protein
MTRTVARRHVPSYLSPPRKIGNDPGHGGQVEVIAPQALHKKVTGSAVAMTSRYNRKGH